ncbi:ribosomal RNA small subunit methyltransferase nep-1-like isoform X2 [Camellia sinensis]|uniref:ribosomal RNA small subunit methyltransferase nep-1-like isoform X2 n=1 Tax=Camellia sinensis TaxID=4442 RepID=UPI00103696CE|nr:ribosomal RNA small subunit methyltransferase nep-1-like isoform X2 [Camellia sinensis]
MARTKPRKRKRREEKYDTEDIEQFMVEEIDGVMGKEEIENAPDEEKETENVDELAGIPIQPYDHKAQTGAIFILEKASLEVAKLGKFYQLLNSDHDKFLRSNNKNPADYRPDIAHQAILAILDSPLNKAGRLRALYVKTENGVLFEIKPYVRIPRTYKRFSGMMSLLLQKLSITAVGESEKLLRVIKNPVTQYLPLNSRKIGFSYSSEKLVDIRDYVAAVSDDVNFVFVVGAMAYGKIDIKDYADDFISISGYPMSAVGCISRICGGLEHKWKIL